MAPMDGRRGRAVSRVLARSGTALAVVGGSVALSACGSSGHSGARKASSSSPGTTTSTSTSTKASAGSALSLQQAWVSTVRKVRPEVVEISTSVGLGSGVIYDSKGDIVTNHHVVGSATHFQVRLVNGQTLSATLVGAYAPDDLAVIRVTGGHNLSPATFGDSSSMEPGDVVFAVGNPLGLASSVTQGIVSYNGRAVSEGNGVELPQTIQTSAPINPGNSGGALVDLTGQVIGIPTLAAVDQQIGGTAPGIGFAIPSNTVKLIVPQLIATGHVTRSGRAALGIAASDAVGPLGQPVGVIVQSVQPGGAAAKAGIAAGDVITAVNGHPARSLAGLQDILAALSPGNTVSVTVMTQNGAKKTVTVVLGQLTG